MLVSIMCSASWMEIMTANLDSVNGCFGGPEYVGSGLWIITKDIQQSD
jgi:hypothetical protein